MAASINNYLKDSISDPLRTIRITEVVATGYPENGYSYRGRIQAQNAAGTTLGEQYLQTRRKPEWLVNGHLQGYSDLLLSLQYRHENDQHWQTIAPVVIPLPTPANDQSSTDTYLPLRGWDEAPHMQVRIRLTKEQADDRVGISFMHSTNDIDQPSVTGCPFFAHKTPTAPPVGPEPSLPGKPDESIHPVLLTAPEQVLVKDNWNKFLAYQDMLIELFVERLLHEEPELINHFGDAIDLVPTYFASLFDVSVRQLMPHTEQILRESYRGTYPKPPEGYISVDEYVALLADLGMRPNHWLTARRVWVWVLNQVPHLEDYDRENLNKGNGSAMYRFFTGAILIPALNATRQYTEALTPDMIRLMRQVGDQLSADARVIGTDFYHALFQTHPDIIPYFNRTDIDSLTEHLMQAVGFLVRSLASGVDITKELRELSQIHTNFSVPPDAYPKLVEPLLTVMRKHVPGFSTEQEHAWVILLNRVTNVLRQPMINQQRILTQAKEYIDQISAELTWDTVDYERRWEEIKREILATGSYTHTYEELAYGAQLAWRNASKCIGRISWRNMIVRDLRHVTDPDEMFRECAEHLRMATNGGNLQIVMNVFRPKKPMERWGPRIWNSQYIRFAGYEQADGTVLGDKANVSLTKTLLRQGWVPPTEKTAYDTLPLVIDVPGQSPRMYQFSDDDVLKVPIEHPNYPALNSLDMKWCAIPAIANFRMDIGGIQYGCIPFNGWFMETEIARNLWEEGRYEKAESIAKALGLDTSSEQTLWRDRAFLELNVAVLHSFSKAKVTLVDHQTAARQFLTHDQREKRAGRECPAQWSWVVPSAGGSVTPVWHHEMRDFYLSPSYHYAADRWVVLNDEATGVNEALETDVLAVNRSSHTHRPDRASAPAHRPRRVLILYGSETGTAEHFAHRTARRLNRFQPRVMALDEYDVEQLPQEDLLLVITSTFREGHLPGNAQKFYARIQALPQGMCRDVSFSVMALGSTVYPHFCAAGTALDRELARIGGNRVIMMHKGDEIKGQANTFRQWLDLVARLLGEDPTSTDLSASADPALKVTFIAPDQVPATAHEDRVKQQPGYTVPVLANRELLKEVIVGSRSTRFIALDISAVGTTYETGDHVAIYPHNPPAFVHRIIDRLNIDADAWFITPPVNENKGVIQGNHVYTKPVRVWQVLTEDVDLTVHEPLDDLLRVLLKTATSPVEKNRLESWLEVLNHTQEDNEAVTALKKYITDTFLTVTDLLDDFPSARLSFGQLLDVLPRQKPRLYSISSCSLVHPTEIHLTVGVVQITTDAGKNVTGLCSNYLAQLDPVQGDTVRIAIRSSGFRPPLLPQAPMLMVGAGTGLSPLVGFLQHREVQLRAMHEASYEQHNGDDTITPLPAHIGHARLFFGCRNLNDYLYQQELETWHEAGVLTHLDVAFSRLDDEKIYVQDLIGQRSKDLWDVLSQPDCHYYICGDGQMADDVFEVLMTIAKTTGGLSHAEAVNFFRQMQAENRFVMDVWGVLINVRNSLAELQEAKYTQGERWLERVSV
ncbi:nitric oxide synthase oxygenase [Spirosoma fluviale]|uniref:nitric oxide dioxygenase n=1 Tax=Spirosoma fluviale TaxID=1597977 RepID=A0A286GHZ2_9BACT|nr:nitric oxide synthase oxygenase [Spirosoma fluviale]SOD94729.1 Sulfite reductase, alpha subunit (flavoprotein) [Spirosoma fluviale]